MSYNALIITGTYNSKYIKNHTEFEFCIKEEDINTIGSNVLMNHITAFSNIENNAIDSINITINAIEGIEGKITGKTENLEYVLTISTRFSEIYTA